jgi:predicted PurR-regulated permease PerM
LKEYFKKYKKLVYCILLLIFFMIFTFLVRKYFEPFFIIIVMLFLCSPINNFLNSQKLFGRRVNAVISIAGVNGAAIILLAMIGNFIYTIINSSIKSFSDITTNIEIVIMELQNNLHINLSDLNSKVKTGYLNIINGDFLKKSALYTTKWLFAYFIGIFVVYFILINKYDIIKFVKKTITENKFSIIKKKISEISKIAKVELLLVAITTVETILGFLILGIEHFFALGIICGILDLLPYIGTILMFIPLILFKLYLNQYVIATGLICLYLLLIINRQILEMKFMSSKLKIHPLIIILAIYLGAKIFGLIGIIIGPIYVLSVKEIIETNLM